MSFEVKGYRRSGSGLIVSQSMSGVATQVEAASIAGNLLRTSEELVRFEIIDESTGAIVQNVEQPQRGV